MELQEQSKGNSFKIKNIESSLLPDTTAEEFNLLVSKARVYFDVNTPNDNQIKAVSIYGEKAKLLKGLM
jgi:hypothetical protein